MEDLDLIKEVGQENEEDLNLIVENFSKAVVWGTDWTTETINNQLIKGNIDLFPKFQRRDAWSRKQKSKFIESIFLGLPIPQIILAEKKSKRGNYIVIDGKQRLLSIRKFLSSIEPQSEFEDFKLKGLEILKELNGKKFIDLNSDFTYTELINQFENNPIRTTVIKNWPNEEFLYSVFLRLNTGSLKLSPQELRKALHPGEFIDYVDDRTINSSTIQRMLNNEGPDYRMRDVELAVRFYANKYFIDSYNGNLKKFFDDTVNTLNKNFQKRQSRIESDFNQLEEAIEFTIDVFGPKNAFSKWSDGDFQNYFNRAVYDIMVYYFSESKIREALTDQGDRLINIFSELCGEDEDFLNSFEVSTKTVQNTIKRLNTWGLALRELLDFEIKVPHRKDGDIEIKKV